MITGDMLATSVAFVPTFSWPKRSYCKHDRVFIKHIIGSSETYIDKICPCTHVIMRVNLRSKLHNMESPSCVHKLIIASSGTCITIKRSNILCEHTYQCMLSHINSF